MTIIEIDLVDDEFGKFPHILNCMQRRKRINSVMPYSNHCSG